MSGPASMTPAILTSAIATTNPTAMPAAQPQATVTEIPSANTAPMIAPCARTALRSMSSPGARRQSNRRSSSVGGGNRRAAQNADRQRADTFLPASAEYQRQRDRVNPNPKRHTPGRRWLLADSSWPGCRPSLRLPNRQRRSRSPPVRPSTGLANRPTPKRRKTSGEAW